MTIDEAILTLNNEIRVAEVNDRPREVKALWLGIEALKRERDYRIDAPIMNIVLLPGETEP